MLVRASLISALLLSLVTEAGAQERALKAADKGASPRLPEAGLRRAPAVEDLFGQAPAQNGNGVIGAAPEPAEPIPVIRSSRQRVDESGLRYFASQHDQKRVDKEIQRLKALYPDWTPPDDIFLGPPGGPEEQPFWDLFAQDRVQEMRAAIAEKMKSTPKWKPSAALIYKLERKETRIKLVAAYDLKQWRRVIEVAAADPKILTCSDMDVQWKVADAFARTNQKPQAFEVYRFILSNCRDKTERLSTVRKSLAYFEPREVDILVAMGARNDDGTSEFDDVRVDLIRIRLGRTAAGNNAEKLAIEDLSFFERRTRAGNASADASLLGWFRLKEKENANALAWFTQAMEWPLQLREDGSVMEQPDKMVEGRILALKGLERFEEAEALAAEWAPRSDTIRALFIDIVGDALLRSPANVIFTETRLQNYALAVGTLQSRFGAQALGWYHFNRAAWSDAIPWFQAALEWNDPEPADAVPDRNTAGTPDARTTDAKTADAKTADAKAADAKTADAKAAEQKVAAAKPAESRPSNARPAGSKPAPATAGKVAARPQAEQKKAEPAPATPAAASAAAPAAADPREKIAEGLVVSLRNGFRFDEAEELSYMWRDKSATLRRLYIDIFAESLVRQSAPLAFAADRISRFEKVADEDKSATAAQGLAWYFHDRANWTPAIAWFRKAMDWYPERDVKLAEGYAQSLRRDGQFGPASDVAYEWRDQSPVMRAMFYDISADQLAALPLSDTLSKDKMARLSALTTQDRSVKGAAAIGWHNFDRRIYAQSLEWFQTGLDYRPEGEQQSKMREGFALSLRYVGRTDDAEDRAYEWRATSEMLGTLYFEIAAEALTRLKPPALFPAPRLARFVEAVNADKSSFGAQAVGWYFQQRGDNRLAAEWFGQSLAWGKVISDAKTAQGYLLALLALGRMDDADALAFEWYTRSDEFRTLYIDTFGGALLRTEAKQAFPERMLRRFEQITAYEKSVFGSQAIGWYFYDRQDWASAARWFESSLVWSGAAHDPKTVEGFSQSIRYLARREDAEELLYAWADKNPLLRKLYIELMSEGLVNSTAETIFSDVRLNRFAAVVLEDKDSLGAQGLAWYRHDRRQWPDAVRWFKYAREWQKDVREGPNGDAKMAEGLAFSLRKLDLYDESEAVSAEWKDRSPALRKLYSETVGEYIVRLKSEHAYPNDRMERYLETVAADRNNVGAQSAGWYFYDREMFAPAAEWFEASLAWGPDATRDRKTAEGYVEALRRTGRLADAETAAWQWIDRSEEFQKIYLNIASEVISALKPPATFDVAKLARLAELTKQFQSPTGALGFAWYHQARSQWQEASWWFERALEWGGDVEDVKAIEGYMIALISTARYDEAEELALKWRNRSDKIASLYIDVFGGTLLRLPPEQKVPEARLAKFLFFTGEEKSQWGAQAAGWYFYDRQDWREAARWFEASLTWTKDGAYEAKTVEGFSQSIRYFARREEAEEQLYPWRDKIPAMRKLYIELFAEALVSTSAPVFFSDERLDRYARIVMDDRDWFGAQGLAWYRHDRRQWPDAVRWFKYAREWHVGENGVRGRGDAKIAEGLAFSLRNLDLYDESEQVSAEWKDIAPAMRKLYSETVGEYIVRLKPEHAYPNDRMRRYLETALTDHNNIAAQSAGWYFYARDMFNPAAEWFLASLQWGPDAARDPKTAEGYVTSLRRAGRLADAEAAAFDLRDRSPALSTLYFEIAGEVISAMKPPASFPVDRLNRFIEMTEETRSMQGALAVAWYMQARENWRDAAAWFERALDWSEGNIDDPKVAEGYIIALLGLGRFEEAEALVHKVRGNSPDIARVYLDLFGASLLKMVATQQVPADRLDRYAAFVGLERNQFGAQALAWYHQERRNWADAARWFQTSLGWTQGGKYDVKNIEGFAQALRFTGRREDAEDLLYMWRGHSSDIAKLYLDTFAEALISQDEPLTLSDRRIDRFAQIVLSERSAMGAQALAWYRYNRRVWGDAARWFKSARAWSPDGLGDAKLAEGLAFTLRNMDLYDDSENVSWEWRDRAPAVRKLYIETVAEYLVRLKERETYGPERMARYLTVLATDRSSIGAQAVGWYYFGRNNFADAARWFRNALDWGPDVIRDPKTAEGLMTALRNSGRADEAETLAYQWRGKSPRFAQLYAEIAAESLGRILPPQSVSAERMSRFIAFARETRNPFSAQAIGWYRAARKEWSEAAEWFKLAMDWTGDEKDAKTIEGYVLALRNLGRTDEAETLAFAWRDRGDAFAPMYIDSVLAQFENLKPEDMYPADRMANFARLVRERQHIAGAAAIGWYKLARNEDADGESWFRTAMEWAGENKDMKLVEGFALALKKQQKFGEAEQLAFDSMGKSEEMRALYRQSMIEQMVASKPPAGVAADRLKKFSEYTQQSKHAESARALGWYYYDRKEWPSALIWFKNGQDWEKDPKNAKSAEGYVLTLKNMGKIEDAEAYAYESRDKSDEMRSLYIDLVPEMLAKLEAGKTFPAERMTRFAAQVTAAKSAYGAQSIAWYRHARNEHAQAVVWFKSALDWSGEARDPKTVEGYVLSLRATGQFDLAEQTAFEWRDRADALRGQFVEVFAEALTRSNPPPAFAPERLSRYVAVVSADKNAVGAQALGWYSYNIKQMRPARAWFEKAMQWAPSEGAALGLALSARAMKDNVGFANIIAMYRGTYPKLMELLQPQAANQQAAPAYATTQPQGAVSDPRSIYATTQPQVEAQPQVRVIEQVRTVRVPASPARSAPAAAVPVTSGSGSKSDNAACIARVEAKQRAGTATANDMVAKGWCLLNADRPQEAAAAFDRGRGAKGDDAAYGSALAKLRSGETDAAAYVGQGVQSAKKRNDVGLQVLAQRAIAANRAGRHMEVLHNLDQRAAFAGETRDLTMMRGWALWNVGRKDAARRIFTELDRQLSTNETQSALGVVNEVRGN